tara:strand:- start:136211 stop:137869 length:1659 start_codon:yes stop_codon:yes gene_type:complete
MSYSNYSAKLRTFGLTKTREYETYERTNLASPLAFNAFDEKYLKCIQDLEKPIPQGIIADPAFANILTTYYKSIHNKALLHVIKQRQNSADDPRYMTAWEIMFERYNRLATWQLSSLQDSVAIAVKQKRASELPTNETTGLTVIAPPSGLKVQASEAPPSCTTLIYDALASLYNYSLGIIIDPILFGMNLLVDSARLKFEQFAHWSIKKTSFNWMLSMAGAGTGLVGAFGAAYHLLPTLNSGANFFCEKPAISLLFSITAMIIQGVQNALLSTPSGDVALTRWVSSMLFSLVSYSAFSSGYLALTAPDAIIDGFNAGAAGCDNLPAPPLVGWQHTLSLSLGIILLACNTITSLRITAANMVKFFGKTLPAIGKLGSRQLSTFITMIFFLCISVPLIISYSDALAETQRTQAEELSHEWTASFIAMFGVTCISNIAPFALFFNETYRFIIAVTKAIHDRSIGEGYFTFFIRMLFVLMLSPLYILSAAGNGFTAGYHLSGEFFGKLVATCSAIAVTGGTICAASDFFDKVRELCSCCQAKQPEQVPTLDVDSHV